MLELKKITKTFPGVKALSEVSVNFVEGEIHAILGENGAGKSTLMKIICGIYQATSGQVVLDGEELHLHNYNDAVKHHISIVNQEINLIPEASIAENICLDKMSRFTKAGFVDWKKVNKTAQKYMDMVGLKINPTIKVRHLSAAHKQQIQIAKALSTEAKVLMLDEPTSSLTQYEADILFDIMRGLKKKGIIMIFVSHKLDEVMGISDKVTVFRDGCLVGTELTKDIDQKKIVRMMIGREFNMDYKGRLDADNHDVAFKAEGISSNVYGFHDLGFEVRKGEILGFYGLVGSGRTELIRTTLGIDPKSAGKTYLNGEEIKLTSFSKALHKYRIGYVTENRKEEGLFLDNSISMNVSMNSLDKFYVSTRIPFIQTGREKENSKKYVDELEIKAPKITTKAGSLSGGNQQKVSIAKWLSAQCDVIVFDEPTVGVDIGAKSYIHDLIWNLAKEQQKAVILISSDMNEIIALSRRMLIFKDNKIVAELKGEDFFAQPAKMISEKIGEFFV